MPTDRILPLIGNEDLARRVEGRPDATCIRSLDVEAVWLVRGTDVEERLCYRNEPSTPHAPIIRHASSHCFG